MYNISLSETTLLLHKFRFRCKHGPIKNNNLTHEQQHTNHYITGQILQYHHKNKVKTIKMTHFFDKCLATSDFLKPSI